MRVSRPAVLAAALSITAAALLGGVGAGPAHASTPRVLLVGTYKDVQGDFSSIQAAVNAANPGDWILVGPGVYHEQGVPTGDQVAGVLITTPGIHLRGMDRNHTVVDGTLASAPNPDGFGCDGAPSSQQFSAGGRNGVEVYKVDGVSVDNLTVCNYLSAAGGGRGNEIWFNGGDGSGHIGMGPFSGQYLTASSSYNYGTDPANQGSNTVPMGQYGIFTSNEKGPGLLAHTYSSNMGDSAYYIGACPDCGVDLTYAHAVNSALGFSGTNAGGHLVIENGEWEQNKAGIAPNALNNDDWPSPPNGACPGVTPVQSCSIIRNNYVHDNNNGNAPSFGIAGAAPTGTGILLSGVENYTVTGNTIVDNNSWGLVVNDFPDTETPPADAVAAGADCRGGTVNLPANPVTPLCYYQAFGNEVENNAFGNNGKTGNPGDGDIAVAAAVHNPGNCFHGNTGGSGPLGMLSSDPPAIQTVMGMCGLPNGYFGPSLVSLVCGTPGAVSLGPVTPNCPPPLGPGTASVTITPIPHNEATMSNPCVNVPQSPWCPNGFPLASTSNDPHRTFVAEGFAAAPRRQYMVLRLS